ncbi:Casein kinase II subunit beta' [Tritrichomonas foetus]|uniref:Casein kinase II subunit beta n=1 Tax=Tritrichomonas foetus TaxID=1144522 RepID=A0A1J4JTJ8_9EUKA|nr:Casein kinase II subunit beta' [Tritrichomonas foetus]|eukprot:OHT00597.1 Casein kinase II subunit beta' [Tritrichomonas foetus]
MTEKWIDRFLARSSSRLFVRIDQEFLSGSFNVYGLKSKVDNFNLAYELVRKGTITSAPGKDYDIEQIEKSAELLYGLLHVRYLLTKPGMQLMLAKYVKDDFPQCPRVYCKGIRCLPFGISEEPGEHTVRMYCPCCNDVYNVTDSDLKKVDGAFFGLSWVHMFLSKFPQVVPKDPVRVYVPRIFGFRICHPDDVLDEEESESESS